MVIVNSPFVWVCKGRPTLINTSYWAVEGNRVISKTGGEALKTHIALCFSGEQSIRLRRLPNRHCEKEENTHRKVF